MRKDSILSPLTRFGCDAARGSVLILDWVYPHGLDDREFCDANPGTTVWHERNLMLGPERPVQVLWRRRSRVSLEFPTVQEFSRDVNAQRYVFDTDGCGAGFVRERR